MSTSIKLLLLIIVGFPLFVTAQSREFEGVIKYRHEVIAKTSDYNVNYDYEAIGMKSDFFYKRGNYKFVNEESYFKGDLFRADELKNYLLLHNSDTVLLLDAIKTDIEVVEWNITKSADTILNFPCDVITLKIKPLGQDFPVSYRRYYFSKELPVDSRHFQGCKGNAYELIYAQAQSLALKIEFEWPNRKIIWEAYEVEKKKLGAKIFQVDKRWVLQKVN